MGQKKVLVLNGPNLNLLGMREPSVYGFLTLGDIEAECMTVAEDLNLALDFRQTNHEGQLVDWIHDAVGEAHGIVINAAAYSHTSIAIQDALKAVALPVVEVHLSNIYKREDFRHHSFVSAVADGVICGLGSDGYGLAIQAMAKLIG